MAVTISVYVESIATTLLSYDNIKLYSDTTPGGSFGTLVSTTPLVAGQTEYEITDAGGTANSYYRYTFLNSISTLESAQSYVILPGGMTMQRLRVEAAQEGGLGFASLCTSLGTTTTLNDAALADSAADAHYLEGAWIYRPNAVAAGDKLRRVANSGYAAGALTVSRAWTNAPANGEVYQIFNLAPPIDAPGEPMSWDRVIRTALANLWFTDQIILGTGTSTSQTRFPLGAYAAYTDEDSLRRVLLRTTDSNGIITDTDGEKNGRFWSAYQNTPSDMELIINPPPMLTETVILEFNRTYEELWLDTDVTTGPPRLAKLAVMMVLYRTLNALHNQSYEGDYNRWLGDFRREYAKKRPRPLVRGV